MKLKYKTRRKLSYIVLLVWLPLYIVIALQILAALPQDLNIMIKTIIYIVAALLWLITFRFVFLGVGKPDPDAVKDKSA